MLEHFSTARVDTDTKLGWWNTLLEQTYSGLRASPMKSRFDAEIYRWSLGETQLTRPRSSAAVVTREHKIRQPSEQSLAFHLLHHGAGPLRLRQRGRDISLKTGDLVICAGEEPYRFDIDGAHELLIVELPRRLLADRVPFIDNLVATQISGDTPGARILRSYLLSIWREGDAHPGPAMLDAFSATLLDLLALPLNADQVDPHAPEPPLVRRMKRLIEAHLPDQDLSPARLAGELGVPLRTLQAASAQCGITPLGHIMRRRLERAAELLILESDRQVIQIAYDCGFSDSSYFARQFQKRFGVSPSHYRQRH